MHRETHAEEGLVWMRIAEAASRLGCDPATIRRRYRNPNYPYRYHRRKAPDGGVEYGIPQEELEASGRPTSTLDEKEDVAAAPGSHKAEPLLGEQIDCEWRKSTSLLWLLEDQKKAHRREVDRLEERVRQLQTELRRREERIAALETRVEELEERLQETLRRAAETNRELAHRIAALVGEVQQTQIRVLELSPLESEVPRLRAQIREREVSLRQAEERLSALDRATSKGALGFMFRLLRRNPPAGGDTH